MVFSDETKINCFNANGRSWCWINERESVLDCAVKQIVKHGGGSVMLWSCMISRGLGDLQRVERCINAKDYIALLHIDLYLSLERLGYYNLDKVNFQHDNAPIYKAKIVQKWPLEQPFSTLEWPAQSPDLNPIKYVWAILEHRLNSYLTPIGLLQLWEWRRVSMSLLQMSVEKLYASMPNRIATILTTHGKWIDLLVLFTYGLKK